jgi:hypothetical protein
MTSIIPVSTKIDVKLYEEHGPVAAQDNYKNFIYFYKNVTNAKYHINFFNYQLQEHINYYMYAIKLI